jgi:isopenicillin N synthase-like dioxygenase
MNLTSFWRDPLAILRSEGYLRLQLSETMKKSVEATFDGGYAFFRQPIEMKIQQTTDQDLGYRAFGDEYSISPEFPDQLESFSVSPRLPIATDQFQSVPARVLYDRMSQTFDLFEPIVEDLTITLAQQLTGGRIGEHLKGKLRYWSRLQLNYTRPSSVDFPFINETHEDLDLLTINCASGAGLELRMATDSFLPINTGALDAIVFPGEIAWLLSGGELKPMFHRVRTHRDIDERVSLLFFADPEPQSCEPWVSTSINHNVDIGVHVRQNVVKFGLKGFRDE